MNRDWTLDGYECEGPHEILRWCEDGPSVVVARGTMRGRPWFRAVRKIGAPGWHVSGYKRKRDAIKGEFE